MRGPATRWCCTGRCPEMKLHQWTASRPRGDPPVSSSSATTRSTKRRQRPTPTPRTVATPRKLKAQPAPRGRRRGGGSVRPTASPSSSPPPSPPLRRPAPTRRLVLHYTPSLRGHTPSSMSAINELDVLPLRLAVRSHRCLRRADFWLTEYTNSATMETEVTSSCTLRC